MILLDPDLDPDPAPGKQDGASALGSRTSDSSLRLPTARALSRFLNLARAEVRLSGLVSVLLTTDVAIRRLNRQFRGKNKATDVLSFPTEGPVAKEVAGDLAISVPTARRQATEQGHTLGVEVKVLILHGLLHLAGYDHETDDGKMARKERLLRSRLKLPQGLIERSSPTLPPRSGRKDGAPSSSRSRGTKRGRVELKSGEIGGAAPRSPKAGDLGHPPMQIGLKRTDAGNPPNPSTRQKTAKRGGRA